MTTRPADDLPFDEAPDQALRRQRALRGIAAIVGVAFAVRLLAARGGLWLDEMLSLGLATAVPSAWDLVARVHHDNNHVLNSLWMRALGEQAPALLLRLPGIVGGTLAVILLARWRWDASPREGVIAAAFGAVCLPLVQCGSEARGYGLALAATFGAIVLAKRAERSDGWSWAAAYWLVTLLGILSHLSFLFVLAGLCSWGLFSVAAQGLRARGAALLRVHAVPAILGIVAWLGMARDMTIAGGPNAGAMAAVGALSHVAAGPANGAAAWILGAVVVIGVAAGLVVMARRDDADAALVALCAVVAPATVVVVLQPEYLVPRYFLLPTALVAAPVAALLAEGLAARGAVLRAIAGTALLALLLAHAAQDVRLIETGRGDGVAALQYVRDHARRGDEVTLGADNDFRLRVLLWRSRKDAAKRPAIRPVPGSQSEADPPEWLLTEEFRPGATLPSRTTIRGGAVYAREAVFPHAGVTGITWGVYRRIAPP